MEVTILNLEFTLRRVLLKKLSKTKVNQFLSILSEEFNVYVPILKNGRFDFDLLDGDAIYNIFEPTYSSFKKILIPHCQQLYSHSKDDFIEPEPEKNSIIIGLNGQDIEAINLLRQIMSKPKLDQPFMKMLDNTTIVSTSSGLIKGYKLETAEIAEGYDLLWIDADDEFYLEPTTDKGKYILSKMRLANSDLALKKNYPAEFALFKDKELITKAITESRGSKIWQDLAKKCIGCSNCTAICPLCYCFDIKHTANLAANSEDVSKIWDSCFFKSFAATSGKNFRESLEDRIYHFFDHKFVQAYHETGQFNCNHCGRCVAACPAKINIFQVLDEIIKKYQQNHEKSK